MTRVTAVEFEEPQAAIGGLQKKRIKISKLHLSSALKVRPLPETRVALAAAFARYLSPPGVTRDSDGKHRFSRPGAGIETTATDTTFGNRVAYPFPHFIAQPADGLVSKTLEPCHRRYGFIAEKPYTICSHLEMKPTRGKCAAGFEESDSRRPIGRRNYDWTLNPRLADAAGSCNMKDFRN